MLNIFECCYVNKNMVMIGVWQNECTDINMLNNLNLAYRQESDKLDENVIFSKHCYPVTCFAQRYHQTIS